MRLLGLESWIGRETLDTRLVGGSRWSCGKMQRDQGYGLVSTFATLEDVALLADSRGIPVCVSGSHWFPDRNLVGGRVCNEMYEWHRNKAVYP